MSCIEYTVKVWSNGHKEWYLNDKLHNEDGPAIEYANGSKEWWLNNKRHCEDGPAVEYTDGYKAWHLNDKQLTEEEFNQRQQSCSGKVVEVDGKKYKLEEV